MVIQSAHSACHVPSHTYINTCVMQSPGNTMDMRPDAFLPPVGHQGNLGAWYLDKKLTACSDSSNQQMDTTSCACGRCLDLGLQDPQMRDALLSEGLLETALPLLGPDAGNGPLQALLTAVEALQDCFKEVDGQAGWA